MLIPSYGLLPSWGSPLYAQAYLVYLPSFGEQPVTCLPALQTSHLKRLQVAAGLNAVKARPNPSAQAPTAISSN